MYWTTLDLLLRGGLHEIMPGPERDFMQREARKWMAHPSLQDDERTRIQSAWVDGQRAVTPIHPTRERMEALRKIAGER